jgi:hypothetical protein
MLPLVSLIVYIQLFFVWLEKCDIFGNYDGLVWYWFTSCSCKRNFF